MRIQNSLQGAVVALTSLGLLIPQTSFAGTPVRNQSTPSTSSQPAAQASMIHDIALGAGGVFRGQVLDTAGAPLVGVPVSLWRQQQQVAASTTDSNGQFEISGLGGGIYRVETPSGPSNYRLWAPGTAPHAAHPQALLVGGGNTLRGQFGHTGITWPRALILAGLVGAAIALPIALSNGNNDAS